MDEALLKIAKNGTYERGMRAAFVEELSAEAVESSKRAAKEKVLGKAVRFEYQCPTCLERTGTEQEYKIDDNVAEAAVKGTARGFFGNLLSATVGQIPGVGDLLEDSVQRKRNDMEGDRQLERARKVMVEAFEKEMLDKFSPCEKCGVMLCPQCRGEHEC